MGSKPDYFHFFLLSWSINLISFDPNAIRAILFTYLKSDKRNLELLLTFQLLCLLPSKAIDVQILLLEKIRWKWHLIVSLWKVRQTPHQVDVTESNLGEVLVVVCQILSGFVQPDIHCVLSKVQRTIQAWLRCLFWDRMYDEIVSSLKIVCPLTEL